MSSFFFSYSVHILFWAKLTEVQVKLSLSLATVACIKSNRLSKDCFLDSEFIHESFFEMVEWNLENFYCIIALTGD